MRMSRDGKSTTRTLTLITLSVLMYISADYFSGGAVRDTLRPFVQPVATVVHGVSDIVLRSDFWKTRNALQMEVERLSSQLEREQSVQAALMAMQAENDILRLLARVAEKDQGVTVPVVSSFSSSPYGTFVIGGGSGAGIQVGDTVIAGDGFVLGSVTDVAPDTAIVRAVFSPGTETEVVVEDIAFLLTGRGAGNARADVPRELPLSVGNPVVAPAFGNRSVGVIGRIESASSSAFSDVFVRFPYNLDALRFVFVTTSL